VVKVRQDGLEIMGGQMMWSFIKDFFSKEQQNIKDVEITNSVVMQVGGDVILNVDSKSKLEEKQEATPKHYKIPHKYALFSGRSIELSHIENSLETDDIYIVSGLSGVGKSQLVRGYIYQNYSRYNTICWITASNQSELIAELCCVSTFFGITKNPEKLDDDLLFEVIKHYFEDLSESLLIIDNADNIDFDFLILKLSNKSTKIIITTQNSIWDSNIYKGLVVKDFTPEDAKTFILKNSDTRQRSDNDENDANELSKLLHYYPLAMEYARAHISKRKISIREYIHIFCEYNVKLFSNDIYDYKKSALTAWKVSMQSAIEISNQSCEFLSNCSVLSPYSIPMKEIFIENKVYDILELNDILDALLGFSLLQTIEGNCINIHPMTQSYVRMMLREQGTYEKYINQQVEYVWMAFPDIINNVEQKERTRKLIPHGLSILEHLINDGLDHSVAINIASDISGKLYNFGKFNDTIVYLEKALEIAKNGGFTKEYISFLNTLSMAYHYKGNGEQSVHYSDLAVRGIEDNNGKIGEEYDALACTVYGNRGIILKDRELYTDSLQNYRQALYHAEKTNNNYYILNQLSNMAIMYRYQHDYPQALRMFNEILSLCENDKRMEAKTLANIATVHKESGNINTAISLYKEVLEISEAIGEFRFCAIALDHLGTCYLQIKDFKDSLECFQQALEIADDIDFAIGKSNTLLNLGWYYYYLENNIEVARKYFLDSLEISTIAEYKKGIKAAEEYIQRIS